MYRKEKSENEIINITLIYFILKLHRITIGSFEKIWLSEILHSFTFILNVFYSVNFFFYFFLIECVNGKIKIFYFILIFIKIIIIFFFSLPCGVFIKTKKTITCILLYLFVNKYYFYYN